MKPSEILGLVEEACGTRLYEMKKMQAQKTMEKKESKVNEINKLLREGVSVCWLLSRRHHADAGEVAKSAERVPAVGVELDRDRASAPAGDGVPVLPGARDASRGR